MEEKCIFNIKILQHLWQVHTTSAEKVKNKINEERNENEKAIYGFGVTELHTHKIYINNECCMDEQISTLKHELMHAYLWSVGAKNFKAFDEEDVCNFSSEAYSTIEEGLKIFKGIMEKQ